MLDFKGGLKIKFAVSMLILIYVSFQVIQLFSILYTQEVSISNNSENMAEGDSSLKNQKNYIGTILALFLGIFLFWSCKCTEHIIDMYLSIKHGYEEVKDLQEFKYNKKDYKYLFESKGPKEKMMETSEQKKQKILAEKLGKNRPDSFMLDQIFKQDSAFKNSKRKNTSGSFSESDLNFFYPRSKVNHVELNAEEKKKKDLLRQYEDRFRAQMKKLQIENYKEQIVKTKNFLCKLLDYFVKQSQKNKEKIKEKMEEMYKCNIVWYQSEIGDKMMTDFRRQADQNPNYSSNNNKNKMNSNGRFGNLFDPQSQPYNASITLDTVINLYKQGKIEQYFIQREKKDGQKSDKSLAHLAMSEIYKLLKKQLYFDSFFRFSEEQYQENQRKSYDQMIGFVLNALNGQKQVFSEENFLQIQRFQNHYEVIESLLNIFIKLLNAFLPSKYLSRIYTSNSSQDPEQANTFSIFQIERKAGMLLHYGLWKQEKFKLRTTKCVYDTKPGKDNIFSIFMIYLNEMKVNLEEMTENLEKRPKIFY